MVGSHIPQPQGIRFLMLRTCEYVTLSDKRRGFPGGSVVKNLPVSVGDTGWNPGWERSTGGGNGNPLQYSCLGKPMDKRNLVGYSLGGGQESLRRKRKSELWTSLLHMEGTQNISLKASRGGVFC